MTTRYVNTASSPGGDGTTNATSGANRAYASLNEAEAGLPASLSDSWRIVCEGSAADTTAVTFSGVTTSASNYIEVWTDPNATNGRHAGAWNTSKYRLVLTNPRPGISVVVGYVRLDGLQLDVTGTFGNNQGITITGLGDVRIKNCIIRKTDTSSPDVGIDIKTDGATAVRIFNCIIYDFTGTTSIAISSYGWSSGAGDHYIYNNTFQNCVTGISRGASSDVFAVNNLFRSCTAPASGTFAAGTDYNATDNASVGYTVTGGGNTHDRVAQTFTFVNEAADDFHLASSDAGAKDFGVSDPGSGLFSDDIDGQTRSGTWDIGADEYVSGGGFQAAWAGSATHIVGVTNA